MRGEDHNLLREALVKYYTRYYRYELGLKDWRERVERRLEEEKDEKSRLEMLGRLLNYNFKQAQTLVVGCGTGGVAVELHRLGAQVYGIEPSPEAINITALKARLNNLPDNFIKGVAEHIPFRDNSFDFIICFTVLEHVGDVEKSLAEMVRVLKNGGYIYIVTPDYRFPYEGHYKLFCFPKFRLLTTMYLKLLGRPTAYYKGSVNLLTAKGLNNILMRRQDLHFFRIFHPYSPEWLDTGLWLNKFWYFFSRRFEIYKHQEIVIRKLPSD